MSSNVIIFASFIILVASSIGVQFGASVTRYVRGVSARFILGISILIASAGTILKLLSTMLGEVATWLDTGSLVVTFSGMGLAVIVILALFVVALRYQRGEHIPAWMRSLVAKED